MSMPLPHVAPLRRRSDDGGSLPACSASRSASASSSLCVGSAWEICATEPYRWPQPGPETAFNSVCAGND